MRRALRRAIPFALALIAFALAAGAAFTAREAGRLDAELRQSDAAFRVGPTQPGLWKLDSSVPGFQRTLGVEDDVAFRRASRLFELLERRGRDPYDFAARAFRADAQLALARAKREGLTHEAGSKAANLEGVLTLGEALGDPQNGPALMRRTVDRFRRAVRLDPRNEEAPFNLELVLRLLRPDAVRVQIRYGVNTAGRGVAGAAPRRSGHGY